MAREGGLDRDARGLGVPDLADHDDVGVGAEHGPQALGEGEARLEVHLDLVDPGDLVLDGVLHGEDVLLDGVDRVESRVERRGLSRSGRPGHQHRPVRLLEAGLEALAGRVADAERVERQQHGLLVEEAHDDPLATARRKRDDADVHVVPLHL